MRVLVCGSRHFEDSRLLYDALDEIKWQKGITTIISGGARGADTLAERYAENENLEMEVYPANWEKFGKSAGPIRNGEMLIHGKPDLVVAFLAKNNRGTKNMIEQAEKAGVPVHVVQI